MYYKKGNMKLKKENALTKYRPKLKLYKLLWEFHVYDEDFFPSVPHGHSIDGKRRYKLDIYCGNVYDINDNVIGKADEKSLHGLHRDPRFTNLVIEAIKYYNSLNPRVPIEESKLLMDNRVSYNRYIFTGYLKKASETIKLTKNINIWTND
jgi:hypothetical protein